MLGKLLNRGAREKKAVPSPAGPRGSQPGEPHAKTEPVGSQPAKSPRLPRAKARDLRVERFVQRYGDLLFDLCESVLWSPTNAQLAFRAIVKELAQAPTDPSQAFETHERSWVLRVACENLRHMAQRHGRKVTAAEQLELDASPSSQARLKRFDVYFHRLPVDDKMVLLLRDKYDLPYPEIANAMGVPAESLKTKRQLALRALEDWIWSAG